MYVLIKKNSRRGNIAETVLVASNSPKALRSYCEKEVYGSPLTWNKAGEDYWVKVNHNLEYRVELIPVITVNYKG